MSLTGTEKSAIMLMTLGEDHAAEVFKHLSSREVQQLSTTMASMRQVSHQQLVDVLAEFEDDAEQYAALSVNASDYLRSVLIKPWEKSAPPVCWKTFSNLAKPPVGWKPSTLWNRRWRRI